VKFVKSLKYMAFGGIVKHFSKAIRKLTFGGQHAKKGQGSRLSSLTGERSEDDMLALKSAGTMKLGEPITQPFVPFLYAKIAVQPVGAPSIGQPP
jgi:hypothetical protein